MKKILVSIFALCAAGGAQAQSPNAIMERAANAYASMRSVRAEFTQTITNPITGTSAVSRGELLRKQPNLLSINFTSPKGDRIVSDGKSLWIYLPSSAPLQVIRMPASASSAMALVDPTGALTSSPSSHYTITGAGTEDISGRRATVLSLSPKKTGDRLTRAKVWIDESDYSIRQFEVVEASGLVRLVTITSLRSNASIPSSAFTFAPPKGTRVLDSSALSGT
jgi:outer membrane lipoprotein carrier protein